MLICLGASTPAGASLGFRNPLRDVRTGHALSCPDPHVIDLHKRGFRYFMVCTTDRGANGIAIKRSPDLVHWYAAGYVFPKRRQPWWALRSGGRGGGRFWAPEIYRVGGKWVVYFSAALDSSKLRLPLKQGTMVLGVAKSATLHGPWRTRVLHYRGEFNASSPAKETFGGTIDPSVVRSPRDGGLYLFWAVQASQIWVGRLSPDGMTLRGDIRPVLKPTKPWECQPGCTLEGPEPFFDGSELNLLYSGASTWDASYAVGLALGTDPLTGTYSKLDQPVLRSGRRFIGPGHSSQPVIGPDGHRYVMYHALTAPDPGHVSNRRLLMIARVTGAGARLVMNGTGRAG